MTADKNAKVWVVLVSETVDGETTTQVVQDGMTYDEAEAFMMDMTSNEDWTVEICTEDDAAAVVTE